MTEIEKFGHKITFCMSGTGLPPDDKSGMSLNAFYLYVKLDDSKWFTSYGNFNQMQISEMIEICKNEYQLISLFELLSAVKEKEN